YFSAPCAVRSALVHFVFFFFSSRRRHTRSKRDWSSDVCSSDLSLTRPAPRGRAPWRPHLCQLTPHDATIVRFGCVSIPGESDSNHLCAYLTGAWANPHSACAMVKCLERFGHLTRDVVPLIWRSA